MKTIKLLMLFAFLTFICQQQVSASEKEKLSLHLSLGSTYFASNVVRPLEETIEPRLSNTQKSLTGLSPEIRIICDYALTDRCFVTIKAGHVFPKTFNQQFNLPNEGYEEMVQFDKMLMDSLSAGIGYKAFSNSNWAVSILAGGELNFILDSFSRRELQFSKFGRTEFGNLHQTNIGFWTGGRIEMGKFFVDLLVHFFTITLHGNIYSQDVFPLPGQNKSVIINETKKAEDYWGFDYNKMTTFSVGLGIKI